MSDENSVFSELQYIRGRVDAIYSKVDTKADKEDVDDLEVRVRSTEQGLVRQGFIGTLVTALSGAISAVLGYFIWFHSK